MSANLVSRTRGFKQLGTLDYNPLVSELGANRRPEDAILNGVALPGTSTSVLQYHLIR